MPRKIRIAPFTIRRDGRRVRVKGHLRKDVGAPGRTPESKKWFVARPGALGGWTKWMLAENRRRILRRLVRNHGYATVIRRLVALKNVSVDRETDRAAEADIAYLQKRRRAQRRSEFYGAVRRPR